MRIRAWERADLPKIAALEQSCFSDPWTKENFESAFALPVLYGFVAEEDERLLGYCVTQVVCEDAELQNIAVAKEFRGKGIAKELLTFAEENAREKGAEHCFLEVRVSNAPALGLYRKFGYGQIGVRKRYYANGEDALVMKKVF
ncbi:MAG: ribosomal protein S18-alanine N-acetyltransferase [Clostridia bacterium]|nr:ribosomal protein S18-alanine N-acetyltransferase [Clostridia bacterium]